MFPPPGITLSVQLQGQSAGRVARPRLGHPVFGDLARPGVELSQVLLSEVDVPDHAVRPDFRVVRRRRWVRKIILRNDDLSGPARRTGEGLEVVRPLA
jgi:hypothetical protein